MGMPEPAGRSSRYLKTWFVARFLLVWTAAVLLAFALTVVASDPNDSFDGLNNLLQVPFTVPLMFLVPGAPQDNWDLWVDSLVLGLLNGPIIAAAAVVYRSVRGDWAQ